MSCPNPALPNSPALAPSNSALAFPAAALRRFYAFLADEGDRALGRVVKVEDELTAPGGKAMGVVQDDQAAAAAQAAVYGERRSGN